MRHYIDYELAGHEVMLFIDDDNTFCVDIRKDNDEGEIIGAYNGIGNERDARFIAKVFIEGYKYGYGHGSTLS